MARGQRPEGRPDLQVHEDREAPPHDRRAERRGDDATQALNRPAATSSTAVPRVFVADGYSNMRHRVRRPDRAYKPSLGRGTAAAGDPASSRSRIPCTASGSPAMGSCRVRTRKQPDAGVPEGRAFVKEFVVAPRPVRPSPCGRGLLPDVAQTSSTGGRREQRGVESLAIPGACSEASAATDAARGSSTGP